MQNEITKKFVRKDIVYNGELATLRVEIRFDDTCRNGHPTFSITGNIYKRHRVSDSGWLAGGCIHDEIREWCPELAHLIPWHLCSSDGPLHYRANTVYLAGDRDYNGRKAGEPLRTTKFIRFDSVPIRHKFSRGLIEWLEGLVLKNPYCFVDTHPHGLQAVLHPDCGVPGKHQFSPKYTFGSYPQPWHSCPFDNKQEALEYADALTNSKWVIEEVVVEVSRGKGRELEAARRAAIWPEATDEELCADDLAATLDARLPALLRDFAAALDTVRRQGWGESGLLVESGWQG